MTFGRRGLRRSAEPRRTSGRQGEAFRLADLGHIAPWGQRQASGRRNRRRGGRKSVELGNANGAEETGGAASRLAICCEGATGAPDFGGQDWRQWRCRRRASRWPAPLQSSPGSTERRSLPGPPGQANAPPRRQEPQRGPRPPRREQSSEEPVEDYPRPQTKGRRM